MLSIGIFFSLMIIGLSATLPQSMSAGLLAEHVPADVAARVAAMPPVAATKPMKAISDFISFTPKRDAAVRHTLKSNQP